MCLAEWLVEHDRWRHEVSGPKLLRIGDDGLWNVEEGGTHRDDGTDRQFSIDSNSWVLQSCGRVL
jgi:hypothetical protein